jgi:hypothetical protein
LRMRCATCAGSSGTVSGGPRPTFGRIVEISGLC